MEAVLLDASASRLGLDTGAVGSTDVGMGVPAGHWVREPDGLDVRVTVGGRRACRPREHARPGSEPDDAIDVPPPPPGTENERDPIADAEAAGRVRVVVPGTRMPYYVIRPPGSYPYGPGGVVVPGAVPPFVSRILDQVLP